MSGSVGDNPYRASGVIAAAAAAGGGVSWQTVETGTTFTAVAGNGYPVNTTSNACTVTLPASASVGDEIIFTDYLRTWATNNLTINPNSLNYQGNSSPNPVYDTNGESVHIVYVDVTQGWVPTYDGAVALETPQSTDHEYLVVAGGAAGGDASDGDGYGRGGGGAGGYLSNYGGAAIGLSQGTTYTITVGTGGVLVLGERGGAGVDSSIAGTGLTTITATGGGGGGGGLTGPWVIGGDGGSGGGGGVNVAPAGGSGNTPSTSPSQGNDGGNGDNSSGGGGGGSGAVGAASVGDTGGDGGDGTANSITGSSVTYAGGGGGGGGTKGTGGTGGGGNGYQHPSTAATVGTDGLGGGGGGGGFSAGTNPDGADGGNGIVILRVATADKGTPTGEDSSAVDGADTVITWLTDGSYVA